MSEGDRPDPYVEFDTNIVPAVERVRLYASTVLHIEDNHSEIAIVGVSLTHMIGTTIQEPSAVHTEYDIL